MNHTRPAFTIIEFVFVIVVLAILGSIVISKMAVTRDDAKLSADVSNMAVCIHDIASHYASKNEHLTSLNSGVCEDIVCFEITYSTHTTPLIVETNSTAAGFCSDIEEVGGHLAKTYNIQTTRIVR